MVILTRGLARLKIKFPHNEELAGVMRRVLATLVLVGTVMAFVSIGRLFTPTRNEEGRSHPESALSRNDHP